MRSEASKFVQLAMLIVFGITISGMSTLIIGSQTFTSNLPIDESQKAKSLLEIRLRYEQCLNVESQGVCWDEMLDHCDELFPDNCPLEQEVAPPGSEPEEECLRISPRFRGNYALAV